MKDNNFRKFNSNFNNKFINFNFNIKNNVIIISTN